MSTNPSFKRTRRRLFVWTGLVLTLALFGWQLSRLADADLTPANDSVEYWAAGVLARTNGNPYDPEQLLPIQQSVGWPEERALMMWNPPWVLSIAIPFSLLPYGMARTIWMIFLLGVILFSADWFWRYYRGGVRYRLLIWLLSVSFFPSLLISKLGQITPVVLLGILLFLHFERRQEWWLAGASVALATIKPQLLVLFWLSLLFWMIQNRRWQVLAGGGIACILMTTLPVFLNPRILQYYVIATTQAPPMDWATPTLGGVIRFLIGSEHTWIQFMPTLLGAGWFLYYWHQHRRQWNWSKQLPVILLTGLFFTSYGWTYDQILLIPVLMQVGSWAVAGRLPFSCHQLLIGFAIVNGAIIVARTEVIGFTNEFGYFWVMPVWLIGYNILQRSQHTLLE